MIPILVKGATIKVTANTPAVSILVVTVSANSKINLGDKSAVVYSDVVSAIEGGTYAYVTASHTIVGALSITSVSSSNNTSKLSTETKDVMLKTLSGTVNYKVDTPANIPGTPPVPDMVTAYTGTWAVVITGQIEDKIFSN